MYDAVGKLPIFVYWGERDKAFIACLARGSGRLISPHQWNFTGQYRKAEECKQLREAGAGGKGCEPVCLCCCTV